MTELAINVNGLIKAFGNKRVVNGISLQIPTGEVWGFLGPNGSGKTTTIRMLCGLLTPTSGSGTCLGYDIVKQAELVKSQTGYMTQKFSFWEDLTIRENLEFVARMYCLKNVKTHVDNILIKLDLCARQNQLAGALSGGWKQRLALAAVTMHCPKLLLLDEPTAGVDPKARREFWDEIHLLSNQGITVLVSTHYMDEAERCDKIAYLANGQLVTCGSVNDVIKNAKLFTFKASDAHIRKYQTLLKNQQGIDSCTYFGSALHISGKNHERLIDVIQKPQFSPLNWQEVTPSLEDVFISLISNQPTNTRPEV